MTACFLSLIQNLIVKVAKIHEKRTVVPRENQEGMAFQPCRKAKRMTNLCKAAILFIYGFLCGLPANKQAVPLCYHWNARYFPLATSFICSVREYEFSSVSTISEGHLPEAVSTMKERCLFLSKSARFPRIMTLSFSST